MKLGITRDQTPILVNRLAGYIGGMIAGIGAGMLIATEFVPQAEQQIFDHRFYFIAVACLCAGGFVATSPSWMRRKTPKGILVDEKHVA